jgi:hypothetical protein
MSAAAACSRQRTQCRLDLSGVSWWSSPLISRSIQAALTRQVQVALFMDGKLDAGAFEHMSSARRWRRHARTSSWEGDTSGRGTFLNERSQGPSSGHRITSALCGRRLFRPGRNSINIRRSKFRLSVINGTISAAAWERCGRVLNCAAMGGGGSAG